MPKVRILVRDSDSGACKAGDCVEIFPEGKTLGRREDPAVWDQAVARGLVSGPFPGRHIIIDTELTDQEIASLIEIGADENLQYRKRYIDIAALSLTTPRRVALPGAVVKTQIKEHS